MTSPIDIRHVFKRINIYIFIQLPNFDLDPSLTYNKMNNTIYRSVGTFPKCYNKIVEIGAPNTQIHDHSLS